MNVHGDTHTAVLSESNRTTPPTIRKDPPGAGTRDGSGRDGSVVPRNGCVPRFLPDTARSYVGDDRAQKIAVESVKQMDEMALIGYPILTPEQRAVYEVTIRQVAEGVLE